MIAFVTGASSGPGRAIAMALAEAGYDLALQFATNRAGVNVTRKRVEERGRKTHLIQADFADLPTDLETWCDDALADIQDSLGAEPDVLVLAAWPGDLVSLRDMGVEESLDPFYEHGLRPAAALLRAAAGSMEPGSVIITIGSIEGFRAAPDHLGYAVSKAALHHLTAAAAHEFGPDGIRVVGVAPGLIERPGLREDWPEGVERWSANSALGRPVTPEEVAATVAFLASPGASGITGVTIPVDAGWSSAPGW